MRQNESLVRRLYFALSKRPARNHLKMSPNTYLRTGSYTKFGKKWTSDQNIDGIEVGLVDRVTLWTFGIDQIQLQWPSVAPDNLLLNWFLWSCIAEKVWRWTSIFTEKGKENFKPVLISYKRAIYKVFGGIEWKASTVGRGWQNRENHSRPIISFKHRKDCKSYPSQETFMRLQNQSILRIVVKEGSFLKKF